MHADRHLSLFMAFMTIGANFVSLCPASDTHAAEVHLSIVTCTAHECNRAEPSHSCEQQECEHDFCCDKSLLESFLARQTDQLHNHISAVPVVITDMMIPAIRVFINCSSSAPPVAFQPLFVPLRI